MTVYLDTNATTPLRPEARVAMLAALDDGGNPSSVHGFGRRARARVELVRRVLAGGLAAAPEQVIFTSGGTEANALALRGAETDTVFISATSHDSARKQVAGATLLPVLAEGTLDLAAAERAFAVSGSKLLSLEWVNNETGVIQPVAIIAELCRKYGVLLHLDAVQALGRVALEGLPDYLSLSAHKIGGPQGIGALVVAPKAPLRAQLVGGGQERGRRAGTENVAGIAGFGAAFEKALSELSLFQAKAAWRDRAASLLKTIPGARIMGEGSARVANTLCVVCPGLRAETLLMQMDLAGFAVSSGSACSSGKVSPSHVLMAMGASPEEAESAIRLSFGWKNTEEELLQAAQHWTKIAQSVIK